ncbi:MAG: thioredoxin domain-containing protein [Rickettsiaceae bacterium]|nr:thioredoxin domain-containing protein [Rickettsiaceae bacterium]
MNNTYKLIAFLIFCLGFYALYDFSSIIGAQIKRSLNKPARIVALYDLPKNLDSEINEEEGLYIINFFASWCGPCIKELPILSEIAKKNNVPIYGVVINDRQNNAMSMLREQGYEHLYKSINFNFPIQKLIDLDIDRIPRMMIVMNKKVIYDHTGEINHRILSKRILPLLEAAQNPTSQEGANE